MLLPRDDVGPALGAYCARVPMTALRVSARQGHRDGLLGRRGAAGRGGGGWWRDWFVPNGELRDWLVDAIAAE